MFVRQTDKAEKRSHAMNCALHSMMYTWADATVCFEVYHCNEMKEPIRILRAQKIPVTKESRSRVFLVGKRAYQHPRAEVTQQAHDWMKTTFLV